MYAVWKLEKKLNKWMCPKQSTSSIDNKKISRGFLDATSGHLCNLEKESDTHLSGDVTSQTNTRLSLYAAIPSSFRWFIQGSQGTEQIKMPLNKYCLPFSTMYVCILKCTGRGKGSVRMWGSCAEPSYSIFLNNQHIHLRMCLFIVVGIFYIQ